MALLEIIQKSDEQIKLEKLEARLQKVESSAEVEIARINAEREEKRQVLLNKVALTIAYVGLLALVLNNEVAYTILNRPLTCVFPFIISYIIQK
jgi:hypothetical protein